MADRGAKYADKKLSEIDRELRKVYRQAQKELTSKLSDFNKRFRAKDREKQQQMDKGEISKQQYKDWLAGQVFMRSQWERKLDQVNEVMLHHNEQAMRIINESRLDVFAENYYSEAFKANWIIQDVGFNVYSTHAIARLLEKQPQILPKWKIDEEKDYKWNEKKVNNIIQQGIIQGEGVDQIGRRLCEDLCSQNESKMTMFARTAITGAQNAGRQEQMNQAAAAGIKVNKRWVATMDNRTRDLHRARDGEEVAYDDEFSGGIEYPGDPTAPPEEVYNCRCTMETVYPEYADRSKEWREDETIDGVPYEEWKEAAEERIEERNARKRESESITVPNSVRDSVTRATASTDWFDYEYARLMKEYSRTGVMPDYDMQHNPVPLEVRQRLAAEADLMQRIGSETNTGQKMLYRGMVVGEDEARTMFKRGQDYIFDSLTATSKNLGIAGMYHDVENFGGDVPVIMRIEKPDGIFGFARDDLETVLPKGSTFKVSRVWTEDGVMHVDLYARKGRKNVR